MSLKAPFPSFGPALSEAEIMRAARRLNPNQHHDRWQLTKTIVAVVDALQADGFILTRQTRAAFVEGAAPSVFECPRLNDVNRLFVAADPETREWIVRGLDHLIDGASIVPPHEARVVALKSYLERTGP